MLLNFTVENCLSFKSEQEFTMLRKGRHGTQEEQGAWSRQRWEPLPILVPYRCPQGAGGSAVDVSVCDQSAHCSVRT